MDSNAKGHRMTEEDGVADTEPFGDVIWHITMSLDGFIAGRDDSMDWAFGFDPPTAPDHLGKRVAGATGAILAGRRWHDVAMAKFHGRAGIYGGDWEGPVFVLTHEPPSSPEDPEINFLSGPLEQAVSEARRAAGAKSLGIFGADLARQCLNAGLIDEIVVHVAPLLLGDGVRLIETGAVNDVRLEQLEVTRSPDMTDLRYRVRTA